MSALLTKLRETTHQSHENLHVHPALRDLAEASVTEDIFKKALIKFYGFYKPLEDLFLVSDLKLLADFQNNELIANLGADLTGMGVAVTQIALRPVSLDRLTLEQGIAYLYLREGSALGGQVISKNLARSLDKKPGVENRYFYGRGAETGHAWKQFMSLCNQIEDKLAMDEVSLFAAGLFAQLDEWLSVELKNAS